ncbi:MAG: Uma2 family endonuclease [Cytophagales bacterium]|jgi:Uma2 family endonuclease|nr:Uma2 family endonuclease [Cytophagales bacterium]
MEYMEKMQLRFAQDLRMDDEEFFRFCQDNPELKFERTKNGDIIFMALAGGETGANNSQLTTDFSVWNRQTKFGLVFGSNTGFRLSDTSVKSPNVAVVEKSRWESLTVEQRKKFPPLCPDCVLELKSPSDSVKEAQDKMEEWLQNGCRLGWLIDTANQTAYVYRPGQPMEETKGFQDKKLSGENVLSGFELDLNFLL